jgi:hypothetical protein
MIEIITNPELRTEALQIATPLMAKYEKNKKSIRRGKGHYLAKLAEMASARRLGWKHIDTFHADTEAILVNGQNRKVEIKVKDRNVPPQGHYNATVACYNTKQACDYYMFCSTLRDEVVYILTIIPKDVFLANATLRREGELDPDGPPGQNWKFRADCYNMPYNHVLMNQIGKTPI